MFSSASTSYLSLLKLAMPIILANAAVPLLGLTDTAVIGHSGNASDLGAIALSTLVFNFLFWGFGFLRMGTTGFVSQALGANQLDELHALVFRTVLLGALIGVALIALQWPIYLLAHSALGASPEVNERVGHYFFTRIWGAPATLITFAIFGTIIGMGWSKTLLVIQLLLNGLNLVLNLVFVLGFKMGIQGIALGTIVAEWLTLFVALHLVFKKLELAHPLQRAKALTLQIINYPAFVALAKVNSDIMIRTLALIIGFAWFTRQGALFGDQTLAANHVLLQIVSLSTFFLDGYANVAETLTGRAFGAKNRQVFKAVTTRTSVLAGFTALLFGFSLLSFSSWLIPLLVNDQSVQQVAFIYAPLAALYIFLSFAAFQLDGIFIGVTYSRAMRNAGLFSLSILLFFGSWWSDSYGNQGLWWALILYVITRALSLGLYYPKLLRRMQTPSTSAKWIRINK